MKSRLLLAALLTTALACGGLIDTEEIAAQGEAAMAEGAAFGETTDLSGCLREGLAVQATCGDFEVMCQGMNHAWTQACLSVAAPVEGFCDGVPVKDEVMDTARWRVARCQAEGYPDDGPCPNLLDAMQIYCHDQ